MLTYHNDNARTGANTNETLLTPANVNTNTFGLLFKYQVDGYVYTQPLFVPGLVIPGQGTHNAVFVATENNSVYALDADSNAGANGGVLWQVNFGEGVDVTTNHEFGGRYHDNVLQDMLPKVGITGTSVIDPVSGTLYVVALKREVTAAATNFFQYVHALNITTGAEQPYSPVLVTATYPGTGVGSSGGVVTFTAKEHNQRCALTLAGGVLYLAYCSYADTDPYHGWIIGFNPANLKPLTNHVFNTTPNATTAVFGPHAAEGGLWMGGNGLCVDASTNLYFEVGNGSFSADTGGGDYGDSFMKLSTSNNQLAVADYFTPFNQAALQSADADLGSGGPMLLPDEAGSPAHPHLIVGGGKEGKIYLVDRDNMGHYNPANDSQIVQSFAAGVGKFFCTPAYFNYQLYYQGIGGVMKAFTISNGIITTTPASASTTSFSGTGTTPSISANGTSNAIVWAIQSDAAVRGGPAVLHAYNATNLAEQLYSSSQLLWRDNPGPAVKMTVPTVAGGKVFVGAQNALAIFGNGIFLPAPTITPSGGNFINSVTVTLADSESGATIYYTLDGTKPTTNSIRYAGPFAVTKTADLQAIAIKPGAVNSGVTEAAFVNTAAVGGGSGLLCQYWANATNDAAFATPATVAHTNSSVTVLDWITNAPGSLVGQGNLVVRWSGSLQPQYDDTYELLVKAAGGVRLSVNGNLLVNDWATHSSPVTNRGSITLKAQQLYNIRLDYFQTHAGPVQLLWKRASAPFWAIPQTQLYPFTNPPPTIAMVTPANDASYAASASVTVGVEVSTQHNPVAAVEFFANGKSLGILNSSIYAPVYALTTTGLGEGRYTLTAVATDGSGLSSTSPPVNITIAAGSGLPYGLTTREKVAAFLKLPVTYNDSIPPLLSGTGVFSDTARRTPAGGLIPYDLNAPMWSDGALKSGYLAVPNWGDVITPDQQMRLRPTNSWKFPDGTVFVKNFDLVVDETNQKIPPRRLETQILVRDINGAVYGVTYKWRADNSDADLLDTGLNEVVTITNASGVRKQLWTYLSPSDCLSCHTPVAGYVLGVNTRQLNGNFAYPATGITDNQIRTLNRLGLFSPAINEANISKLAKLSPLNDSTASLEQRARSYLDANCAQCHRPGGIGNFDARYDTPLANRHLVNFPAQVTLGYDNVRMIAPGDLRRSIIFDRMDTNAPTIKMPPIARNRIDTNAVQVLADWINSLPAAP